MTGKNKSLLVGLFNAGSLGTGHDELIATVLRYDVDIMAINETWLREGEIDRAPVIPGYKLRHTPRPPGKRMRGGGVGINEKFYTCCDEPYLDITFNITMRRKTLFYTVNLIIPCMGISFLTVLVFYLPSDSGEKVSLSISILLSLTVFFLLLAEIIPPTSLVVPLLGKFVLFTMILDTFSICVTVVVLNVHFRSPQTHSMAPWVRRVFIHVLPRLLAMRRPHYRPDPHRYRPHYRPDPHRYPHYRTDPHRYPHYRPDPHRYPHYRPDPHRYPHYRPDPHRYPHYRPDPHRYPHYRPDPHRYPHYRPDPHRSRFAGVWEGLAAAEVAGSPCRLHAGPGGAPGGGAGAGDALRRCTRCPELHKAIDGINYIAEQTRKEEESTRVKEDWKYVAMVLDRLFLWIFTLAVLVGSAGIILQAPTLYDERAPIDVRLSEIAYTAAKPRPPLPPR
ncbi:unnamed protein product [Plutella xylostella]|uniref:(diamondback moth) hypothetical protein n=1 Tax=Plutella xylostella TaxID=51655 RepID=A0A8S4G726_PLUXY|nr:unnamed protein product [Plutella xylostella]